MATKINSTAELPDWFDLKKYESVSGFSALDWLRELTFRTLAINQVKFARQTFDALSEEDLHSLAEDADPQQLDMVYDLSELLVAMRNQPVQCQLEGNWFWDSLSEMTALESSAGRRCIRPLTIQDLYLQKNADELDLEDGIGSAESVERWKYLTGEKEVELDEEFPDHPVSMDRRMPNRWPQPTLAVDLNAPDALLIDAFKGWLKSQRLSPPAGLTARRKPPYEWWSLYGLLPYIDLLIWSYQTGYHIPDRVMAEAISSHNAGEDRLRKTIKPILTDIEIHLEGLRELVAAELALDTSGNL